MNKDLTRRDIFVVKVKLGCALLYFLIENAALVTKDEYNGQPAISYQKASTGKGTAQQGFISVHEKLFNMAMEEGFKNVSPFSMRYQPMIVPPGDYTGPTSGCYKALEVSVMRTGTSSAQKVK